MNLSLIAGLGTMILICSGLSGVIVTTVVRIWDTSKRVRRIEEELLKLPPTESGRGGTR